MLHIVHKFHILTNVVFTLIDVVLCFESNICKNYILSNVNGPSTVFVYTNESFQTRKDAQNNNAVSYDAII